MMGSFDAAEEAGPAIAADAGSDRQRYYHHDNRLPVGELADDGPAIGNTEHYQGWQYSRLHERAQDTIDASQIDPVAEQWRSLGRRVRESAQDFESELRAALAKEWQGEAAERMRQSLTPMRGQAEATGDGIESTGVQLARAASAADEAKRTLPPPREPSTVDRLLDTASYGISGGAAGRDVLRVLNGGSPAEAAKAVSQQDEAEETKAEGVRIMCDVYQRQLLEVDRSTQAIPPLPDPSRGATGPGGTGNAPACPSGAPQAPSGSAGPSHGSQIPGATGTGATGTGATGTGATGTGAGQDVAGTPAPPSHMAGDGDAGEGGGRREPQHGAADTMPSEDGTGTRVPGAGSGPAGSPPAAGPGTTGSTGTGAGAAATVGSGSGSGGSGSGATGTGATSFGEAGRGAATGGTVGGSGAPSGRGPNPEGRPAPGGPAAGGPASGGPAAGGPASGGPAARGGLAAGGGVGSGAVPGRSGTPGGSHGAGRNIPPGRRFGSTPIDQEPERAPAAYPGGGASRARSTPGVLGAPIPVGGAEGTARRRAFGPGLFDDYDDSHARGSRAIGAEREPRAARAGGVIEEHGRAASTAPPAGGAGVRGRRVRREEDAEHAAAEYLEETADVFDDRRSLAPPVIGQDTEYSSPDGEAPHR